MRMKISNCKPHDLQAINQLQHRYGKMVVLPEHINKKDISLKVETDEGDLIGFIWVGLMAKGTIGYIDKFCVSPDYAHKGIGNQLAHAVISECLRREVRTLFGVVLQDIYHDKSVLNALRGAMGGHEGSYTFVEADLQHMAAELKFLEEN